MGDEADVPVLRSAVNRSLEQTLAAYDERPQQSDLGGLSPAQATRLLRSDRSDAHGAVRLRTDLTPEDVARRIVTLDRDYVAATVRAIYDWCASTRRCRTSSPSPRAGCPSA